MLIINQRNTYFFLMKVLEEKWTQLSQILIAHI